MDNRRRNSFGTDRLKNPKYTGENRCLPCTAVNVVLAVVLAVVLGLIVDGTSARSSVIGPVVFVGSLVIIYLRGYLIPGTPWLTKRYLPEWVLKTFDKAETHTESTLDPESELRELGLVEIDAEIDDLALTSVFTDAWFEAIANRTTSDAAIEMGVATLLAIDPEDLEVAEQVTSFTAIHDGTVVARWESRAACRADIAGAIVLNRIDPTWSHRSIIEQMELLATLRLFLETCPSCGGEVSLEHQIVESCCRSRDVLAMSCTTCFARLVETPIDAEEIDSSPSP